MLEPVAVKEAYWIEGLTQRQIAQRYDVSVSVVGRFIRKHNLGSRTRSERFTGRYNPLYGKTHSAETKQILRKKALVRLQDPRVLASYLNSLVKTRTAETRERIAAAAKTKTGAKNPFFGKAHTAETKAAISKANTGRFRGVNGSNWQGGKTKFGMLLRNCELYVAWRVQIYERDKYTCVNCGCVGGDLHADHITPLSHILTQNNVDTLAKAYICADIWELSNGRTLCVPCHRKTDTFAGRATRKIRSVR